MSIKTIVITVLFTLYLSESLAQNEHVDSLRSALAKTEDPVEHFNIFNKILVNGVGWQGTNVDSSACFQLFKLAQQLNNDSLYAISYNWLGTFFTDNKGELTTGLEFYFKAIPLAEKANDKRRLSSLYFDIAMAYFDLQNNEEAVRNNRLGLKNIPDKSHPLHGFMLIQYQSRMAQYFLLENNPDSALHYTRASLETSEQIKGLEFEYQYFSLMGSIYAQMGNVEMADNFFSKAITISDPISSIARKFPFYRNYISFLLENDRITGAKEQAYQLLALGEENNNNTLKLAGATFLRQVFDRMQQTDSAYYYSRVEADINGIIFSQSNKNKIQTMVFNEQLRQFEEETKKNEFRNQLRQYGLVTGLGVFIMIATFLYRGNRQKNKANKILETTLSHLNATQTQLIHSEKMASLGELTAGIAHEIQNPLNFVNNFSEVNKELIGEMREGIEKGDYEEVKALARDIVENEDKILHHGRRAEGIVKGMLQHSRTSSNQKEPTDLNALCDEYLRLAYHGLRAKDKSFNAEMETDFDKSIGKINVVPQDIGRVLLNLITNGFYAVSEKKKSQQEGYLPTLTITTKREGDTVVISVKDNGNGIHENIKEKIFQPFFTTKPTGQGTGLGLSLSYDIVKAHGGELKVESKEGEGTVFIVVIHGG